MYCAKCGSKVIKGAAFCGTCGTSLQNVPPIQEKVGDKAEEHMEQENITMSGQTPEKTTNSSPKFYGTQVQQNMVQEPKQYEQPQSQAQPTAYGMGNPTYNNYSIPIKNYDPSKDYTPIGMWGYFGYQLLFAIPFIGFILILIFSFGGTRNINLRNYARSTFCFFIVLVAAILLIALFVTLASASAAA